MADVFQVFNPRVISDELIAAEPELLKSSEAPAYKSWVPPRVSNAVANQSTPKNDTSVQSELANELALARENAKNEGYQQGLAEGQAEATRILAEQSQQLQLAMAALREPKQWIDTELERELFSMTLSLSRQLLRHELSVRPELIENLVHQAIEALPVSSGDLNIYLNPADVEVLRNLAEERGEAIDSSWVLLEDQAVSRGGCRISNDCSRIDEELETRMQRITAEMLGEQSELSST
ncbi:FliH/SctL family protein [Zhongshania aliphaticivorans]|uniref:FliH/SctL family protein n=1 Tax=Zhongshania aliphaticivorans TaxID=1470434 RepID=UPI0012E62EA0|nr:FliH/SctL family protein [Zhongshania aliphaticivorans]CAA0099800.1 Flagellar assembly protein FliH [Zhongshania aliphaticivorans]